MPPACAGSHAVWLPRGLTITPAGSTERMRCSQVVDAGLLGNFDQNAIDPALPTRGCLRRADIHDNSVSARPATSQAWMPRTVYSRV